MDFPYNQYTTKIQWWIRKKASNFWPSHLSPCVSNGRSLRLLPRATRNGPSNKTHPLADSRLDYHPARLAFFWNGLDDFPFRLGDFYIPAVHFQGLGVSCYGFQGWGMRILSGEDFLWSNSDVLHRGHGSPPLAILDLRCLAVGFHLHNTLTRWL